MTKIIADISMSLDGYVTGPDPSEEHGLGLGGEPLHTWAIDSDDPIDVDVLSATTEESGAVVMGRRLFDFIDGPTGWDDTMGYGAAHAATPPFFVVTHAQPETVRLGLSFTFVTEGLPAALAKASAAAGGKDVFVMGGGDIVGQCVDAGLVDELRIHLSPIILGSGTPLLTGRTRHLMTQRSVRVSATATHLVYTF
jgi:dihydrofolate reductase